MKGTYARDVRIADRATCAMAVAALAVASGCLAAPGQGGPRGQGPPRGGGGQGPGPEVMDMSRTLSDRGRLHTIGFSGFAFLTGNLGADSFFPPGKVAD